MAVVVVRIEVPDDDRNPIPVITGALGDTYYEILSITKEEAKKANYRGPADTAGGTASAVRGMIDRNG